VRHPIAFRALLKSACVLVGCCAGVLALACAFENYPSVHFNTDQPDFGAPPRPLNIACWGEDTNRALGSAARGATRDWNQEYYLRLRWEAKGAEALRNARRLEERGLLEQSIDHYRNALRHGAGDPAAIRDRQELVSERTSSLDHKLLRDYLAARRDYEFSHLKRSEQKMMEIAANPRAGVLRAHAAYVLGAIEYDRGSYNKAAAVFERVAASYPRSPRRESALIMIPRSLLRSPKDADPYSPKWLDAPAPQASAVVRSRKAIETLLRVYPQSRFRPDALGWLARCDYVRCRRVAALEAYLRQYGSFTREADRLRAAASVYFASAKLTPADAKRFRIDLLENTDLLAPYLDFRLYHGHALKRDLPRLADLAARAARRSHLRLPSRIAARLAEIEYLRGRYRGAVRWSNQALSMRAGQGTDLALYVRGAARRKSRLYASSESDFERLLRQFPKSYLCGGARENLALLYERRRRPDLALDHYLKLGYTEDIAYALDALMTTRQVAAYLRSHPSHSQRDMLIYTLGIRQLRDGLYTDAERTLARLSDRTIRQMMTTGQACWWQSTHTTARDPRKSASDLAHLDRAARKARGASAKAAALYAQAGYFYTHRDLLFYNAALWQGERGIAFKYYWDTETATRRDVLAVREHHHEHECLNRARELCLRIARTYPHSPTAPKAFYTAGCAAHYLGDFNGWWRGESDRLGLGWESVRSMKKVYTSYPKHPIAAPARKYARVFVNEIMAQERGEMFEVAER